MKLSHILLAAILSGSVYVFAQNNSPKKTPAPTKIKSATPSKKSVPKKKSAKPSVSDSTSSKKPYRHIDSCMECGRG